MTYLQSNYDLKHILSKFFCHTRLLFELNRLGHAFSIYVFQISRLNLNNDTKKVDLSF